jgi:UPF0176 protein
MAKQVIYYTSLPSTWYVMQKTKDYDVIAFYLFENISDPQAEVAAHKAFLQKLDVTSRIYISEQGINAQMSALRSEGKIYMDWLKSREPFANTDFKIQEYH